MTDFIIKGVNFISSKKQDMYSFSMDNVDLDGKMWEFLTLMIKIDMYEVTYSVIDNTMWEINMKDTIWNNINTLISNRMEYPCSYLYMFRTMLLDMDEQHYNVLMF